MPENPRRFYKFKNKYIEERYFEIENLKDENLLPEEKILYDKTGQINKKEFNEKIAKKRFNVEIKEAKKYQKLAEQFFKKEDYEKSFNFLYGLGSPAFILMHALPPRFNLPFPSFRLLKSLKIIDRKYKTKTFQKVEKIYTFENKNKKQILSDFQKAYLFMNKIKKSENPNFKNLGFFDKIKIKYNLEGLKKTFEDYPFVFAYRFIVGCLAMWTFDKNTKKKDKEVFYQILLKVLGVEEINKKLVEEKLKLSKELLEEAERLR